MKDSQCGCLTCSFFSIGVYTIKRTLQIYLSSMQARFKDRLKYKFERFLSKGGLSIFFSLSLVFIAGFLIIIGLRWFLFMFFPELNYYDNFLTDVWVVFLQMTDPGNMSQDNEAPFWLKLTSIMAGLVGVILLSMLIAFITTTLEAVFYEFRKGRGRILEQNHTLILGWNERAVDVIRELIMANESEKNGSIVILAKESKEVMDNRIAKRLPNTKNSSIITTTGDYANVNELRRVNVGQAKSVVLLANCSESATAEEKNTSDVQAIKSVMAIISCQKGQNELPIIAELFSAEKRDLIALFEDSLIIALDSWNIMGKLLVQTSLTSGLEVVYSEIFSFDGCEVYFYQLSNWNSVEFYEASYHFKDGIPLGIYHPEKGLKLRPKPGTQLQHGDQLLILANDDSTIEFVPNAFFQPKPFKLSGDRIVQQQKKVLILGWHDVANIFIKEAAGYLLSGSSFDILFHQPDEVLQGIVEKLQVQYPDFNIRLINVDPLSLSALQLQLPFSYHNVIVLSQDINEQSVDRIDADTLVILLLLRTIAQKTDSSQTNIITQVLNSENQEIITQTDVDDFIISNRLITMILTQLSENPLIKLFYDDIFSEDGSEIYVKPAHLYFSDFPVRLAFGSVMHLANQRNEICLGFRKASLSKQATENFGIQLNLPKDRLIFIEENDFLVVLSEDEL